MEALTTARLDWGIASRALEGEESLGDAYVMKSFPDGCLAAVIDGLGHGDQAAVAATIGVATLESHASEPVSSLLRLCHERLSETRGAAISLASIRAAEGSLAWLAVGNVAGVLVRADPAASPREERLLQRSGVVGLKLPALREGLLRLFTEDTLVLATDGIGVDFDHSIRPADPPQRIADRILEEHGLSTDDALVLVVRYKMDEQ